MDDFIRFEFISFIVMFSIVISLCILSVFAQWRKNNRAPRLTVMAVVEKKYLQKARLLNYDTAKFSYASSYWICFKVESGDCIDLCVEKEEYDKLSEGASGYLTFQGTRYFEFKEEQ